MHVALPGLLFSNIVPAFNPQNVSAMGPLFLVAFVSRVLFVFIRSRRVFSSGLHGLGSLIRRAYT